MNKLTEIANNLNTDKGLNYDEGHGYTEFYYDYFQKLKDTNERVYILEVGVKEGESLRMYNEFFEKNCEIYGIDINLRQNKYIDDNVHLYQFNINDKNKLNDFFNDIKDVKFDFVLDDASHSFHDQYNSLFSLYNKIKPNGKFILEDLHTWSWENEQDSPLRFLNFLCPNKYVNNEQIKEFREHFNSSMIYVHYNERAKYGNKTSSTAIISFK